MYGEASRWDERMIKLEMPALPLDGGCQCGAVRYRLMGAPIVFYHCHCTECQKQSSSAFGESLRVKRTDFVCEGETQIFTRHAKSGHHLEAHFCRKCGTRVYHQRVGMDETLNVKAGSLDDTSWLEPAGHIWTRSKQLGVNISEGGLIYETMPDDGYEALTAKWREMVT